MREARFALALVCPLLLPLPSPLGVLVSSYVMRCDGVPHDLSAVDVRYSGCDVVIDKAKEDLWAAAKKAAPEGSPDVAIRMPRSSGFAFSRFVLVFLFSFVCVFQ